MARRARPTNKATKESINLNIQPIQSTRYSFPKSHAFQYPKRTYMRSQSLNPSFCFCQRTANGLKIFPSQKVTRLPLCRRLISPRQHLNIYFIPLFFSRRRTADALKISPSPKKSHTVHFPGDVFHFGKT